MYQDTTRTYASANGVRQTVGSSSAAFALPTLGTSREVRIVSSVRTFLRFGASDVAASVAGTSIPFPANSPEVVRVPVGSTHFAVIRDDSADGNITLTPVA